MERTLVLIKPHAMERGLAGRIISRYEDKGMVLVSARIICPDAALLSSHYREHRDKSFYHELLDTMSRGFVMAMVVEGRNAIAAVRRINGETDPAKASPGTIRADYGTDMAHNVVHASDSTESAVREVRIWFSPDTSGMIME